MLQIRAVSFKGRPIGQRLVGQFSEIGGTIGRGPNNTLVLPDPERFISRTHVSVSYQAGGFVITDTGAKNPVLVNGRPLGPGSQTRIEDGDRIQIGDYVLEVALAAPRGVPPPVADPFAPVAPRAGQGFEDVPPLEPRSPSIPGPAPADPFADVRGREPKIDDLIGPGASKPPEFDLFEPVRPGPLDLQGKAAAIDPLELFGVQPKPAPFPTVPDQGFELHTPYSPPMPKAAVEASPAADVRQEIPPAVPPPVRHDPVPSVASDRPEAGAAPSGVSRDALWEAFLRGAGIPAARQPREVTPQTMEMVGKLFREAIQGTLDLLRARTMTKSEMHVEITAIKPVDNNPLKFSPTAEVALAHLLEPPAPGYLPPVRAIKDAYDDLRAHQFGFLAGMRAALEDVLARFEPERLENRLVEPGVLGRLLPAHRKAKLWEIFVEGYADLVGEAREDFDVAFGQAFVQAYEAQVKRLRTERHPG